MNLILFGPPGAGKGTQANKLVDEFRLFKISTGDLLREEINKKSSLGKKIKSLINKGIFVPDELINNLVENILSNKKYSNHIIFDGYPRNLQQAKNLELLTKKYNQKINCVLCLKVDRKSIIKRILGRQICSKCHLIFNEFYSPASKNNHICDPKFLQKRADDDENTVISRYETYAVETMPIFEHYKNQKLLYEIDGMLDISSIYKQIRQIILSLET